MLPVSLDCTVFIAPSVFSNIYLSCVLCTLYCQFLWIVLFLRLRYSLTFICPVSCLPYIASFSGLSFFFVPSVFSKIYLSHDFTDMLALIYREFIDMIAPIYHDLTDMLAQIYHDFTDIST